MEANLRSDQWIGGLWRLRFGAIAEEVGRDLFDPDSGPPGGDGDAGQRRSRLVDADRADSIHCSGPTHQRTLQLGRRPWQPRRDWFFGASQSCWTSPGSSDALDLRRGPMVAQTATAHDFGFSISGHGWAPGGDRKSVV